MKKHDYRFIFIIVLLLFACVSSWVLHNKTYSMEDTINVKDFPLQFGEWVGEELPISENDIAILETRNVFVRRYKNRAGDEMVLFIVYSENNRKVSHPPEVCYTGSGVTIVDRTHEKISFDNGASLDTNRLTVEGKDFQQVVLYWFKVGDTFTDNYWRQQGLIALKSFLNQSAGSALIRVSTRLRDDNVAPRVEKLKDFVREIFPLVQKHLP